MKFTVKQLIEQNNEKRKCLTPENETYYEDLLVYIRMSPFKDERATEEKLLTMLDQLLEAEQKGMNAEDVFGATPKQLADQIIQALPKESTKSIVDFGFEIICTLFGWFLIVWGIWPIINQEDPTLRLGTLTFSAVLLIAGLLLLVYLAFAVIKNQAFADKKKKKLATWSLGLVVGILFAVGLLMNFLIEPFGTEIKMSYYTPFGLGSFLLLASYILKKYREAK